MNGLLDIDWLQGPMKRLYEIKDGAKKYYAYRFNSLITKDCHVKPVDSIELGVVKISSLHAGIDGIMIGYLIQPAFVSKVTQNSILITRPSFRSNVKEIVTNNKSLKLLHKLQHMAIFSYQEELVFIVLESNNVFIHALNRGE